MQELRSEAVVLALADFGEADVMVTLLTGQQGKLCVVARNGKRSMRRFGGALELFAHLEVRLRNAGSGIGRLEEASPLSIFPRIRNDLLDIGHAGYAVEVVDRLVAEGEPVRRVFRLLASYLSHLNEQGASQSDRRFFEANLLNILGYRLPLETCGKCGTNLKDEIELFQVGATVRCRSCGPGGRRIDRPTIARLRYCLTTGRFGSVSFLPAEISVVGDLLDTAIAEHLSRPLKSVAFLRALDGEPAESPSDRS